MKEDFSNTGQYLINGKETCNFWRKQFYKEMVDA